MLLTELLEALEATTKRTEKESLLKSTLQMQHVRDFFVAALDPYRTYGLQNIPAPEGTLASQVEGGAQLAHLALFFDCLGELERRDLVGNEARAFVTRFLSILPPVEAKWFHRCLIKNLRCGVDSKTVNKVMPGTVPTFSVQLAQEVKIDDVGSLPFPYPLWCDLKLDGLRAVAIKQGKTVTLHTRKGHEIPTLPQIAAEIACIPGDFVLDGEAKGADWNDSQSTVFSVKNAVSDENMVYHVFDILSLTDWKTQSCSEELKWRLKRLDDVVSRLDTLRPPGPARVKRVSGEYVLNPTALRAYFDRAIAMGYEGIMIKNKSAPYEFKRSKAMIKVKPFSTWEGQITGVSMGDPNSKWAGMFGAFDVRLDNGVVTSVGGGYTDEQRLAFTKELERNPKAFHGRIAEVKGQELTKDGLIRFPVFMRFRDPRDVG